MRILHLASEYPPQPVFGLGRFVRDLAEKQVQQGHSVTVLTNSMSGEHARETRGGVAIHRVDYPPPPKPQSVTDCVLVFNILLLRKALELGVEVLSETDVVCSHDWLTAPAAQALREVFGPIHVCTFHDVISGKRLGRLQGECDKVIASVEGWACLNADGLIANSRATEEELRKTYLAPSGKIRVIPCALAPETFQTTSDEVRLVAFRGTFAGPAKRIVLYVGRLDPEKGVDVLLEAFAGLADPGTRLLLAGTGTIERPLKERAEAADLKGRVEFLGYVQNPALAHLYRVSDILVCPSLYEPFGMVALEGMLQGTATIVSRTGGLAELVEDGVSGVCVPPGDPGSLRQALGMLLANDVLRERLGNRARERVLSHHTWEDAGKRTAECYREFLESRSSPAGPSSPKGSHLVLTDGRDPLRVRAWMDRHDAKREFLPLGFRPPDFWTEAGGLTNPSLATAFGLAVQLLGRASDPPKKVVTFHWEAVLAATIFKHLNPKPELIFIPPGPPGGNSPLGEASQFGEAICNWAGQEASLVQKEDSVPMAARIAAGPVMAPTDAPRAWEIADHEAFRNTFCTPDERLGLVAPFCAVPGAAEAFLEVVRQAVKRRLSLRWVICGEPLQGSFLSAIQRERLPIHWADFPPRLLRSVFQICDFGLVIADDKLADAFLRQIPGCGKTCLVAEGLPSRTADGWPELVKVPIHDPVRVSEELERLTGALVRTTPHGKGVQGEGLPVADPGRNPQRKAQDLVLFNNWGLGDELLLSAVARAIKAELPDQRVWIRSRHGFRFPDFCEQSQPPSGAQWVETIYQNPVLCGPDNHAPFPGHLVQQMLDKVGFETGIKVRARDFRPALLYRNDSGPRNLSRVVLHVSPNKRLPSKDWGEVRWRRLSGLLRARGLQVEQVGGSEEPLVEGNQDRRGLNAADVPALVSECGLVVCLVGFLMHVAAATATPAIVIYGGREHPAIDGYPDQLHLCSQPLNCRGRWGCHLAPDASCPNKMQCMDDLTPELVDSLVALMLLPNSGAQAA